MESEGRKRWTIKNVCSTLRMINRKADLMNPEAVKTCISQMYFIALLRRIQQNKNITDDEIYFFGECFLWANYKQYTSKLIEASRKIIDDVNIRKSLIDQAKRNIRVFKAALVQYEKTEQQKINHDVPTSPDGT